MLEGTYSLGYLPDNLCVSVISRDGESFRVIKAYVEVIKNWLFAMRQIYFYRKEQKTINDIETYIAKADDAYSRMIFGKEKDKPIYECYLELKELMNATFGKWELKIEPPVNRSLPEDDTDSIKRSDSVEVISGEDDRNRPCL